MTLEEIEIAIKTTEELIERTNNIIQTTDQKSVPANFLAELKTGASGNISIALLENKVLKIFEKRKDKMIKPLS